MVIQRTLPASQTSPGHMSLRLSSVLIANRAIAPPATHDVPDAERGEVLSSFDERVDQVESKGYGKEGEEGVPSSDDKHPPCHHGPEDGRGRAASTSGKTTKRWQARKCRSRNSMSRPGEARTPTTRNGRRQSRSAIDQTICACILSVFPGSCRRRDRPDSTRVIDSPRIRLTRTRKCP